MITIQRFIFLCGLSSFVFCPQTQSMEPKKIEKIINPHVPEPYVYVYDENKALKTTEEISTIDEVIEQLNNQIKLCIFATEQVNFNDIHADSTSIELFTKYAKNMPKNYRYPEPQRIWLEYFINRLQQLSKPAIINDILESMPELFEDIYLFLQDLTHINNIAPYKKTIKNQRDPKTLYTTLTSQKEILIAHYKAFAPLLWSLRNTKKIPSARNEKILSIYALYKNQHQESVADKILPTYETRSSFKVYDSVNVIHSPFKKINSHVLIINNDNEPCDEFLVHTTITHNDIFESISMITTTKKQNLLTILKKKK